MNKISIQFKKLRTHLKLTQDEFANEIGVKRNNVSMIESGRNKPTLEILNEIKEKFGVSTDYFFTELDPDTFIVANDIKNVDLNVDNNVDLNVINSGNAGNGVKISNTELDEMIKYKLWYMDFYLIGMLYHTGRYQEKAGKGKFDEKIFDRENAYIKQYAGNTLENIPPAYEQMNAKEKVKLLRELDEVTKIMLDKIWLVTRTI